MKVKIRNLEKKDKIKYLDALYTAISSLRSRDEVKELLKDLLTESERIMIGRRIIIAQKLLQEKSYSQIMDEMGVGIDTISRIHNWLQDGNGGYEKTIVKLEKEYNKRQKARPTPNTFEAIRYKYPLHFFLVNLLDEFTKKK